MPRQKATRPPRCHVVLTQYQTENDCPGFAVACIF
jgi:hypothetical protein